MALVLLAGLIRPGTASSQCWESGYFCSEFVGGSSVEPVFGGECLTDNSGKGTVSIDSVHGTARLSGEGSIRFGVVMQDQFQFTPIPHGPYGSIRLRWTGITFGSCSGMANVNGAYTNFGYGTLEPGEHVEFGDSLEMPIFLDRDGVFDLHLFVDTDDYGRFDMNTRFDFFDLPPGTTVRSCKGYLQELPTPTLSRSWGSLKAAYR